MAALAAMPVPKEVLLKPAGMKLHLHVPQFAYLDAFLDKIEEDANTIYTVVDYSLLLQEWLQATSAVLILHKSEQIKTSCFVAGSVTALNAELYAVCSAVIQCPQANAKQIVIFTDAISQDKVSTDPSLHSGQVHLFAVCVALQDWLLQDKECTVTFFDVPSALR
jgi:hypothetical protein